ncbi:unnamed protein product [Meganyctiphanes norvegica]|uniref:Uncharacterized protein n=1 Tax=Meganyctiphanes norvegica TaxID=48144 RepID=A0AAV2SX72_MEGNR
MIHGHFFFHPGAQLLFFLFFSKTIKVRVVESILINFLSKIDWMDMLSHHHLPNLTFRMKIAFWAHCAPLMQDSPYPPHSPPVAAAVVVVVVVAVFPDSDHPSGFVYY